MVLSNEHWSSGACPPVPVRSVLEAQMLDEMVGQGKAREQHDPNAPRRASSAAPVIGGLRFSASDGNSDYTYIYILSFTER